MFTEKLHSILNYNLAHISYPPAYDNIEQSITFSTQTDLTSDNCIIPSYFPWSSFSTDVNDRTLHLAITFPIISNSTKVFRSIVPLLTYFHNSATLVCAKTNKGDIYYGTRSCILDSQLNPLLIFANRFYDNEVCQGHPLPGQKAYILYVSPKLLQADDLLARSVKRDIIPNWDIVDIYIQDLSSFVLQPAAVVNPDKVRRLIVQQAEVIANSIE